MTIFRQNSVGFLVHCLRLSIISLVILSVSSPGTPTIAKTIQHSFILSFAFLRCIEIPFLIFPLAVSAQEEPEGPEWTANPSADDLLWIPMNANDQVNRYLFNRCCSKSASCRHRVVAESLENLETDMLHGDYDSVDAMGETLLHTAARWGAPLEGIMKLMEHVDVTVTNKRGETFMHLLRVYKMADFWYEFSNLLHKAMSRGLDVEILDCQGRCFFSRLIEDLTREDSRQIEGLRASEFHPRDQLNIISNLVTYDTEAVAQLYGVTDKNGAISSFLLGKVQVIRAKLGAYIDDDMERHLINLAYYLRSFKGRKNNIDEDPDRFNAEGQTMKMQMMASLPRHPADRDLGELEALLGGHQPLNQPRAGRPAREHCTAPGSAPGVGQAGEIAVAVWCQPQHQEPGGEDGGGFGQGGTGGRGQAHPPVGTQVESPGVSDEGVEEQRRVFCCGTGATGS